MSTTSPAPFGAAAPAAGPSIMARLKDETRSAHDAAEQVPFQRDVMAGTLPKEAFAKSLPQLKALRAGLEERVARAAEQSPEVASAFQPYHKFASLYDQDIAAFAENGASAADAPNGAVSKFLSDLDGWIAEDPRLALAAFYVLEGSNMGAAIIRKRVAEAYALESDAGTTAMNPHGGDLMGRWRTFVGAVNALALDGATQDRMVEVAGKTFDAVGAMYNEIYSGQ